MGKKEEDLKALREWEATDPKNVEKALVDEIIESMMDVIRDEDTHPGLKIRAAEVILEHFKKDKGSIPEDLRNFSMMELSEMQLLKIIKERSKSGKN